MADYKHFGRITGSNTPTPTPAPPPPTLPPAAVTPTPMPREAVYNLANEALERPRGRAVGRFTATERMAPGFRRD